LGPVGRKTLMSQCWCCVDYTAVQSGSSMVCTAEVSSD